MSLCGFAFTTRVLAGIIASIIAGANVPCNTRKDGLTPIIS
jgi:hypothetical protein